jgi:hypothetical protein
MIYKEPLTVFEISLKDAEGENTLLRLSIELPEDYPN